MQGFLCSLFMIKKNNGDGVDSQYTLFFTFIYALLTLLDEESRYVLYT